MHPQIQGTGAHGKGVVRAMGGLTERQILYVEALIDGKSKAEAARVAGYAEGGISQVHQHAKVQAALALVMERYLASELTPLALSVAAKLLRDDKTAAGVRANLALGIMDRAGFSAKRFEQRAGEQKDPSQMDSAELQAAIDKLQAEIDGRLVDVTPHSDPIDAQAFDFVE